MTPEVSAYILNSIHEPKQRNIFALLASMEPKPVTRLQLGESVWHDEVPLNSFAKIKGDIASLNTRLVLFGWRIESYVQPTGSLYSISPVYYMLQRIT